MAIDTTVGGDVSDSYLTVEEADARAAADLGQFAAAWASADTEALPGGGPNRSRKEAALRRAAQDLDYLVEHVALLWDPETPQALLFPRAIDVDSASDPYIPERIYRAQYVQAIYLWANVDTIEQAATRRARGLQSFSEPNVSGSLALDADFGRLSPELEGILKPFIGEAVVGWIVPS